MCSLSFPFPSPDGRQRWRYSAPPCAWRRRRWRRLWRWRLRPPWRRSILWWLHRRLALVHQAGVPEECPRILACKHGLQWCLEQSVCACPAAAGTSAQTFCRSPAGSTGTVSVLRLNTSAFGPALGAALSPCCCPCAAVLCACPCLAPSRSCSFGLARGRPMCSPLCGSIRPAGPTSLDPSDSLSLAVWPRALLCLVFTESMGYAFTMGCARAANFAFASSGASPSTSSRVATCGCPCAS